MKRLIILIIAIVLGSTTQLKASHLLGGEITWKCIKSGTNAGKFIFTIKVYRACYQGAASVGSSATIYNPLYASYGGPSTISCTRQVQRAVSPPCNDIDSALKCGLTKSNGGTQVMEENIYVSGITTLYGTPAATGSDFYWTSCCRPSSFDMVNILSGGYYLRASMFPYTDPSTSSVLSVGSSTGGASCYDSSPEFASNPATVICAGYPFTYNHNAVDEELDSLHYEWSRPKLNATNFVTWKSGYSTTLQLPNSNHSALNGDPAINPLTGEISMNVQYNPGTGYHSTGVVVEAWKCRQKVAEIYRDLPVVIITCKPYQKKPFPAIINVPPNVVFKWNPNDNFPIPLPAGDTVWAGDYTDFYLTSTDIQFRSPGGLTPQQNYLYPEGQQFGNLFADTLVGCPYPPCAVLDTSSVFYNSDSNYWEGTYGLATYFYWKTSCNHISEVNSCFVKSNTYNFVFRVQDDWCPAPGMNFQTFAVTVLAPPGLESPQMKCVETKPNGNTILHWTQPVTKIEDSLHSFRKYIVMRSDSGENGPYEQIHVVLDMDSIEFKDLNATANASGKYYFVRGVSSCNDQSDSVLGDTISSMKMNAVVFNSGNSVALDWNNFNPGNRWGPKTTGEYYVWQIQGPDTTLIDTVTESHDTIQINLCYPSVVEYFVTVVDTSLIGGCVSNSTTAGGTVGDNLAPDAVVLDSVSFDQTNGLLHLGWAHPNPDVGTYYIYKGTSLIDSISGNLNTYSYSMLPSDPFTLGFSIQARDTCTNINSPGLEQNSTQTDIVGVTLCDTNKKATITWNTYSPSWTGGAQWTRIYRSENNGPYVLIDSVLPLVTTYSDTSIQQTTFYKYRVRSWENGMNRGVWSAWDSVSIDSFIPGYILGSPDLRCLSWLNDSTTRLEWKKPFNPKTNFMRYIIAYSTDGVNFNEIDSIDGGIKAGNNKAWDSTGYTHVGVYGTDHYYNVISSSGCDGLQRSTASSVLKTIELSETATSDSINQLNWNKVSASQLGPNYFVYRDGNVINNPNYGTESTTDKWVICDRDVTYRVAYPDDAPPNEYCRSYSKLVDGHFEDKTPPSKQFVDSVSMRRDTTFTGMVGWTKNTSKDVVKYYVMNCTAGSYKLLDTVYANQDLYYQDVANAPLKEITQYSVTAVDSCGNNTLTSLDFDCHNTMLLESRMDYCDRSIRLNWNDYGDFTSGPNVQYVIYVGVNGGQFSEIARTDEPKYKHKDIVNGNDYCFYIQAWENSGSGPFTSSTAIECVEANFIDKPEFAYLRYVTVSDTNQIRVGLRIDLDSDIGEYWVKRSSNRDNSYKVIGTIAVPDPPTAADSNFYFQDDEVVTNKRQYFYKIDVVDPCGSVGITSNHGRNIMLQVKADNESNNNILTWNQYDEWNGGVNEYEVYRGVDGTNMKLHRSLVVRNFSTDPTVSQKGEEITFVDNVKDQSSSGNGEFCYKVVAKEGTGTFLGIKPETSESNVQCTVQYPMFYVPTAFTPNGDGLNDRFLPLGAYHDVKSYSLEVYNRWGERIYSSSQYEGDDAGWDGTYKGKLAPPGAYVYIVKYTSADGQEFEKQGTVTISR